MFAPFLIKFSDKDPIKKDDLNNASSLNDKENQTSYFSPVREVHRTHLVNDKIVFANKQRIHHELQMGSIVWARALGICWWSAILGEETEKASAEIQNLLKIRRQQYSMDTII